MHLNKFYKICNILHISFEIQEVMSKFQEQILSKIYVFVKF